MGDDRDELEMPLMPRRDDGGDIGGGGGRRASVVVMMVPRDGSAYGAASSLRLVKQPSQPPSSCSSADGRTSTDRKKSSANGGLAIKSPSKSAHSSVSGKTSAQVRGPSRGVRCEKLVSGSPPPTKFNRDTKSTGHVHGCYFWRITVSGTTPHPLNDNWTLNQTTIVVNRLSIIT